MYRERNRIQLPEDFAQQILYNEMEVKLGTLNKDIAFMKLVKLYTLGFQYYDARHNHRSMYFEDKLGELMEGFSKMKEKNHHLEYLQKQFKHQINLKRETKDEGQMVQMMMQTEIEKQKRQEERVKQELLSQAYKLEQKIQSRRKRAQMTDRLSTSTHHTLSDLPQPPNDSLMHF